jgi:Protein of unknown function (DUF3987)
MLSENQGINLSNHTDLFTKANGTDKYICPICNGNDLSIHKTSGKFNCFNSDGQCNSEIRKFVIEQLGIDSPTKNNYSGSFTKIGIDFYSSDSLREAVKPTYEELNNYQSGKATQVKFSYQNLKGDRCFVIRQKYDDGAKSKPYTVKDGQLSIGKLEEDWFPLNHHLFSEAIGKSIIITEGEKDAITTQYFTGILSTCLVCGGNEYEKKLLILELQKARIKSAIYFYDNDSTGYKKASKLKTIADKLDFNLTIISITELYPDCLDKADIYDFFLDENISDYLKSKPHLESIVNNLDNQKLNNTKNTLNKTLERSKGDIPEQDNGKLITQFIDSQSELSITPSQLSDAIAIFCSQHRIPEKLVRTAIHDRKAESYRQEEINSFLDLNTLIDTPKKKLDLPFLLGDNLGQIFINQAKATPTNPDALFTIFLPSIASLIGTKQIIVANYSTNFKLPYIIRTAIVADSGSAKSAVLNNATWGVEQINKDNMKQYFSELRDWQLLPENERGIKPKRDKIVFKDFNFEGLYKALEENGHGSGLVKRDELKGYFNMVKGNRSGQGDNVQKDLELFEGGEIDKLRMSDDCTFYIPKSAVSMTGCLQWSTLEDIFSDKSDDSGISPRWIFCAPELPEYKLMDRTVNTPFTDEMVNFANYFKNAILPEVLEVSDDAYWYLQSWFNCEMRIERVKANYVQEKSKHNKILSDCIKFAGILHNIHYAINTEDVNDPNVIGVEMMILACYLAEYYLAHYLYCFLKCQKGLLSSQLTKILEIVNKKGECTANEIQRALGGSKCPLSAFEIGELALQLVTLNKLVRVTTKKGVRVKSA